MDGPHEAYNMHTFFLIMFLQEQNSGFPTKTVIPAKAGTRLFTRAALGPPRPGLRRDDGIMIQNNR